MTAASSNRRTGRSFGVWWATNAWRRQPWPHWSVCTTSLATTSISSTRSANSPRRSAAEPASHAAMTRPKHPIDAWWPAESCPRQQHASWLVDLLASTHSTSSWSSNLHNAPSPTEPYGPSSFTHFGRILYEATAEALVGSSIDASRVLAIAIKLLLVALSGLASSSGVSISSERDTDAKPP